MQANGNNTNQSFETFRKAYRGYAVVVYEDAMVYKVAAGYADKAVNEAGRLINMLGLPLAAIPSPGHRKDSFCIKSIEII